MGADLLSQEEIDALLHGVDSGAVETEAPPAPGEARSYDELPKETKDYIAALEQFVGAHMDFISVGPDRKETIFRNGGLFKA